MSQTVSQSRKHVVVAGGTGLIGRALASELVAHGWRVTVLSRRTASHDELAEEGIALFEWDGVTTGEWASLVNGADALVNFVGENLAGDGLLPDRWTEAKKRRIYDSRRNAGRVLLQALETADSAPPLLLQASAIGYYGPRGDEIVTEESSAGDDFLASVCLDWEASTALEERLDVRRVVVRTGLVLSAEGGPLPRILLPFRFYTGVWFGNGRQWWSWIHIDDLVRALRFLLEDSTAEGPFNLTAPNPVTAKEFSLTIGKTLRRPVLLPVPAPAMRLLVGEAATVVLDGQRVVPRRLTEAGFNFRYEKIDEALADLLS